MSLRDFADMENIEEPTQAEIADFETTKENLKSALRKLRQLDKEANEELGHIDQT